MLHTLPVIADHLLIRTSRPVVAAAKAFFAVLQGRGAFTAPSHALLRVLPTLASTQVQQAHQHLLLKWYHHLA